MGNTACNKIFNGVESSLHNHKNLKKKYIYTSRRVFSRNERILQKKNVSLLHEQRY